jgi:hypothetical protein
VFGVGGWALDLGRMILRRCALWVGEGRRPSRFKGAVGEGREVLVTVRMCCLDARPSEVKA